jgi:hypothetical protein
MNTTTYRIRIFSGFCPSENCKDVYERLCEVGSMANYGPDKEIYITNDDDYSHVIILNTAMPQLRADVPKENVIGFAFEPPHFLNVTPEFIRYARAHIGKYFIGDATGLPEPFVERYSHMWHNPFNGSDSVANREGSVANREGSVAKDRVMSIMVSEKTREAGHAYRHKLVNAILETDLPIDVYGRGCRYYNYLGDARVKGEFKEAEPYLPYMYHVAIENFETNAYFSEKIVNALLAQTVPIYMGCRNIDERFPGMVIRLSGDLKRDMHLLSTICADPDTYVKAIDVEHVKNVVYLLRNVGNLWSREPTVPPHPPLP